MEIEKALADIRKEITAIHITLVLLITPKDDRENVVKVLREVSELLFKEKSQFEIFVQSLEMVRKSKLTEDL